MILNDLNDIFKLILLMFNYSSHGVKIYKKDRRNLLAVYQNIMFVNNS